MFDKIKKTIFKSMSTENYLRMLQRGHFFMYGTGMLRFSWIYDCHYFVKKLIRKGDTVIDIGANLGYYSILFSRWVGETGHVYSIEPIKIYNQIFMEKTRKRKNIMLMPYALGTEEKEVMLVSPSHTDYLSSGLPHVYDSQKDGELVTHKHTFCANMKKPSDLFGKFEKIDYIKCDIEGFEYIVLSEMKEVIERTQPILQVELWEDNENLVMDMLSNMGYRSFKVVKGKLAEVTPDNAPKGDWIFIPPSRIEEFV